MAPILQLTSIFYYNAVSCHFCKSPCFIRVLWNWAARNPGRCHFSLSKTCSALVMFKSDGEKKIPLKLRQQTTKSICWSPPTTFCMLPAQPWLFSTQSQALARPQQAGRPPSQAQGSARRGVHVPIRPLPMASAWLAWLCCTGLPPSGWGLHKQKVTPWAIEGPRPRAQFNPHKLWCMCLAWLCRCKGTFNSFHAAQTSLSTGWSTRDSSTIPLPKAIPLVSFKQFCHRLSVARNTKTRTAVSTMIFKHYS